MSTIGQLDSETFRKVNGWSEVAKDNTNTQAEWPVKAAEMLSHS